MSVVILKRLTIEQLQELFEDYNPLLNLKKKKGSKYLYKAKRTQYMFDSFLLCASINNLLE